MTGVQALEHKYPDKLPLPGQCAKMEFEYIRHGTTSLIGFFDVATGRVEMPYLNSTRTEEDFVEAVKALAGTEDKLILPVACTNADPSWFGFLLTCKEGIDRNAVVQYIESKGIQTRMLFAGNLIKHPCFDEMRASKTGYRVVGELTNTDRIMEDTFWVGVYPGMTDEMIDYMAKTIIEAVNN